MPPPVLVTQAALCCEPLPPAERAALAQGLSALASKQLEAALGLVLPRMAPGLLAAGGAAGAGAGATAAAAEKAAAGTEAAGAAGAGALPPATAGGNGAAGGANNEVSKLDVELDLSRCSALELRQLQHFLAACGQAGSSSDSKPSEQQQAAGAAGGSVPPALSTAPNQPREAAATAGDDAPAADAAAGSTRQLTGFPLAGAAAAETSLSEHAGVAWPAVLLGAGLKACSRMLLMGHPERLMAQQHQAAAGGTAAGGTAAAAGGLTGQGSLLPPRPSGVAFAGLKRRSSGVLAVQMSAFLLLLPLLLEC
jgi:hypothetical protein